MEASSSVSSEVTNCPICLETFDNPRSLPCLYAFCLKCIREYCRDICPRDEVPCPVCRTEFQIPSKGVIGLPHNFFIQGLLDERKVTSRSSGQPSEPCEVCLEEKGGSRTRNVPEATKYCVDCEQKLCDQCSAPHRRMRGGGHEVKVLGPELEQQLFKLRGSLCDKHKDKRLDVYCFKCQKNICVTCSAVKHSDHERGEIPELAADFKSQANSENAQMASHISEIRRQVKQTQDNRDKLLADVRKCRADMKAAGGEAKRMIDIQVRKRLDELDSVEEKQVKMAAAVEDNLQLALSIAESFDRYSRELKDKGRPSDVTGAAAELQTREKELLGNDVTSAAYTAPHMTFTASDVNKFTNIDFIGQLQEYQVAQLVHTSPEALAVSGVTVLGDHIYLLSLKHENYVQVEVHDTTTFTLERCIAVPDAEGFCDMTSCQHYLCLYIADHAIDCIHRVDIQTDINDVTQWPVHDRPEGLSVTPSHNLLVTCLEVRKVKEFSSRGDLIRDVTLADDVIKPLHTIQLYNTELIVCHGDRDDVINRVVRTRSDGKQVMTSSGGQKGSDTDQYNGPAHLSVDNNECVFVVDVYNRRVKLLSPTLNYIGDVASRDQFKWWPFRLCLDVVRRRLYVIDVDVDGDSGVGRVLVFRV